MSGIVQAACTIGAVGAGVMGGLLFAFSSFVMRSLDSLTPSAATRAMQEINRRIVNPLFLLIFVGTAAASAFMLIAGVDGSTNADRAARLGAVLYLLGVIVVTATQNIPLNNRLDRVGNEQEVAEVWPWYLARWSRWNHIRTVAAVGAAACFCLSLFL